MRQSHGPPFPSPLDDDAETASRGSTLSIGHERESDVDALNEDFLFHLYRGSELLQDNRIHEAKEELERALSLQPHDTKGQDLIAVVHFRLGLYPRAIQIYEQLRQTNANDPALLLNLSLCHLKTGQPQLARRDLEHLLSLNPAHERAWGYLGLACERMGDLARAERAFMEGGHHLMARRISAQRDGASLASAGVEPVRPALAAYAVTSTTYQELDDGELSFALAEPANDRAEDGAAPSFRRLELGALHTSAHGMTSASERAPARRDTCKPDTRDGPPPLVPSIPQLGPCPPPNRRPTLIAPVGAPPAHEIASEYAAALRIPSQKPPTITLDALSLASAPSLRRPVVAVPSPYGPPRPLEPSANVHATRTLPPPLITPPSGVPQASPPDARAESASRAPSPPQFPEAGVALHASGLALVRTTADAGFAARLESIRAQQSGLEMRLLERSVMGKTNGEAFGGVASPMVLASGDGQLVLAARPGRKLAAFSVGGEMCFAREDALLGFGGGLAFENGRLPTGEGESISIVQLRGDGSVLFETIGEILTLSVHADRSLSVRREILLGWFGRLVPRSLAPSDAPCGQRGLVSFAGEGRVLVTSG